MSLDSVLVSMLLLVLIALEVYRILRGSSSVTCDLDSVELVEDDEGYYFIPFKVRGYPPSKAVTGVVSKVLHGFKKVRGKNFGNWDCVYEKYGSRVIGIRVKISPIP